VITFFSRDTRPKIILARPKSVTLDDEHVRVEWTDGHHSIFGNLALREACPCALCRGEASPFATTRILPMAPSSPEGVKATGYTMVGVYAISFAWSDGHTTGIYPYDFLLELCECDECRE